MMDIWTTCAFAGAGDGVLMNRALSGGIISIFKNIFPYCISSTRSYRKVNLTLVALPRDNHGYSLAGYPVSLFSVLDVHIRQRDTHVHEVAFR